MSEEHCVAIPNRYKLSSNVISKMLLHNKAEFCKYGLIAMFDFVKQGNSLFIEFELIGENNE